MKIRTGFVSNSSSSSFIIYTPEIEPNKLKALRNKLTKMRDEGDFEEWGDSGRTWSESNNFILIETYYLKQDWWDFWNKLDIPKKFWTSEYI